MDRDIQPSHWADLRSVSAGEPCPKCGQPLKIQRAIEVGHVFKLGTKYSASLGANFLDETGKQSPAIMGCYGIGITRTLQAVIEQSNDKDGIIWPLAIAPYMVCITALDVAPDGPVMRLAETLYHELIEAGISVILDDRDERPGVKFKDSELVGFPVRVGIGERSLAKGEVELKRRGGALQPIPVADALAKVRELIALG
jgi:prolyl-tRNA synthetase